MTVKIKHMVDIPKLPPSSSCILCGRKLNEIGGRRVVSSKLRGIALSKRYIGGGNPDFPYQSVELNSVRHFYVVIWGEPEIWTATLSKVRNEFLNKRCPWFCQVCGKRQCSECGWPLNVPMGCEILSDEGHVSHVPVLPFNPGCINEECSNSKQTQA